jgi:uroporphyrin-3 C-methyltransferase
MATQLRAGLKDAEAEDARQAQILDELQSQLIDQQQKLASYSANDHESWQRAETQYLLRLANQRLIMASDVVSAQALLSSADNILRELNDASMYDVRAALAAEQAALRAVPRIDVEGIYLRLSALVEQADQLVIFQLPEQEAQPEPEASDDWQIRLERGYEEAARKLSDYIVIRRRDVPMHALMDPQWEGLVRQNLRMLLEQAQVALLSGNQTLYQESLQRSQHWVAQFFDTDEAAARAMAREIVQLEGQTVAVLMPDLTRSMRALDEAVKKRSQQGGAE